MASLPDLGSLEIDGLDPVTYWREYVELGDQALGNAPSAVRGEAHTLLSTMKLMAVYGASVADRQAVLIRMLVTALTTITELKSSRDIAKVWLEKSEELVKSEEGIKLVSAGLDRMMIEQKRGLFVSFEDFRSAYAFDWLMEFPQTISANDPLHTLEAMISTLKTQSIKAALTTNPMRTRQSFNSLVLPYTRASGLVHETGKLRWGLSLYSDEARKISHLTGNHRVAYINEAYFFVKGAVPDNSGLVSLQVATSGHFSANIDNKEWRFKTYGGRQLEFTYEHTDQLTTLFELACQHDRQAELQDHVTDLLGSANHLKINSPWKPSVGHGSEYLSPPMLFTDWVLTLPEGYQEPDPVVVAVFNIDYFDG